MEDGVINFARKAIKIRVEDVVSGGTDVYLLREASGQTRIDYFAAIQATTDSDGNAIEEMAQAYAVLLAGCLRKIDSGGHEQMVDVTTIKSLDHRLIEILVLQVLQMSGMTPDSAVEIKNGQSEVKNTTGVTSQATSESPSGDVLPKPAAETSLVGSAGSTINAMAPSGS